MLKEKPGICPYEENYYEEEIIKIQDDIEETDEELIEVIGKVPNEKSTDELIEYSDEELIEVIGKASNEKSTKELIEESGEELIKVIGKVSNEKSTKELTKKLFEKLDKYSDDSDEYSDEELDEMFKEITKIKKPNKDESTTDWYDKNKFKKILGAIDRNGFNHKNKIGKLRFNDNINLINDIKNSTISEALAKQKLNALNKK